MEQQTTAPAQAPTKIRSICIDTLTTIMKNQVYDDWSGKGGIKYDEWKDYGVELNQFVRALKDRGFILAGISGYEGTGKSFGMKTLKPNTNIWFNCDDKECTFKGGKQQYGTRANPTKYNLIKQSKTYHDMIGVVDKLITSGMLEPNPFAFLIAHVDDYKSGDQTRQRMKIMGKVSKNGLEDMLTMNYYTKVSPDGMGGAKYELLTGNTGFNTGRTMESQHDSLTIPNDFNLIIQSFDNY